MNRRSKVASVLLCASVSSAFAGGSFVDGVYTINSTADETIGEEIPAAATNVVKTGAKQATLSKASTFAGTVEVNNGILRTTASSYLGSPSAFTLSGNTSQLWFEGASCTFAGWPAAGTVTLQSPNNNFPYLTFKSVPATSPFPFGIHAKKSASAVETSFVVEGGATVGMNAVKGPITIDVGAQLRNWTKSYMQSMFTGAIDSQGTLYKSGQGTLWLTGNVSRVTCKLNVGRGDLVLENAGLFSVTGDHAKVDYSQTIEANLDGFARIAVKSGSTYAVVSTPKTVLKSTVGADANTYGVLQVYDGGVITNAMTLGNSGSGALRQFGGKVYWLDNAKTSNESVGYGSTGYGCYWMSNGTMQCGTDVGVSFGPKGVGYFIQKGGTAKFDYSTYLSKDGGYGEIYTRGDLRDKNTLYIGNDCPDTTDKGCSGVITLDGPDAYTSWHAIVHACQKSDRYVTSFLNVRDGAKCAAGFVGREGDPATFTGKFFVNVNGGTMVSTVTSKETWHNDSGTRFAPDRLTVYERGVTFDVDAAGKVRVWDSPIVKPTGKGIASITLPSDVTDKKYWLGPAKLTITSTSGTGATAICDYEPIDHAGSATSTTGKQFGQQKGVIITSPGWDYEEGTVTCTAHHQNHSFMTTWPCTVTLADNVQTGAVIKTGAGILRLTSTVNDYIGPTVVRGGAIDFLNGTYPAASELALAGGGAIFTNYTSAVSLAKAGGYGTVRGDVTVTGEFRVTCADLFGGKGPFACTGSLTFGQDAELVVTDPENLETYLASKRQTCATATRMVGCPTCSIRGYSVSVQGNELRFGPQRGLLFVVR